MKLLRKYLKKNGQRALVEIIHDLSPEGRAGLKREVEALVKRINLKVIKNEHVKRLAWLCGLLYMLD